jgi:serine/threonine protein kinase
MPEQEAIDRGDYKQAGPNAHWVSNVQKCVNTAAEIASAMAYLHSKAILHNDLNGNNVLLTDTLVAKVRHYKSGALVTLPCQRFKDMQIQYLVRRDSSKLPIGTSQAQQTQIHQLGPVVHSGCFSGDAGSLPRPLPCCQDL